MVSRAQVEGETDIAVGTVIATFGSDGTYTNTYGQSHTAIYLGQDNSGIYVEDQWLDQVAQTRLIPWTTDNSYKSGSKFYVVTHRAEGNRACRRNPVCRGPRSRSNRVIAACRRSPSSRAILRRLLRVTMDPDAETLHPDGKLQEQRWHNLHAAIRPLKVICHYANKDVSVTLPETIDTCVWEHDQRRVRCF